MLDQIDQGNTQYPPVIMVAEARVGSSASTPKIGVCKISPTYEQILASYNKQGRSIDPRGDAESYFVPPDNPKMFGLMPEFRDPQDPSSILSSVRVLDGPKHGKLSAYKGELGDNFAPSSSVIYTPDPGYVGKDRVTVSVTSSKGRSIIISYYINVTSAEAREDFGGSNTYKKYFDQQCPSGNLIWKISNSSPQTPIDLASLQRDVALSALVAELKRLGS